MSLSYSYIFHKSHNCKYLQLLINFCNFVYNLCIILQVTNFMVKCRSFMSNHPQNVWKLYVSCHDVRVMLVDGHIPKDCINHNVSRLPSNYQPNHSEGSNGISYIIFSKFFCCET